jgi:hypothetical protein
MEPDGKHDWGEWSREAVALMEARNRAFMDTFALAGRPFKWNLDAAQIAFIAADSAVVADLCMVGSISAWEESFLWAWANESIPAKAREPLRDVRAFGEAHDLGLLTTAEWPATRAEGLEAMAAAGRILDADGTFVDSAGDLTMFFVLHRFRTRPLSELPWLSDSPVL